MIETQGTADRIIAAFARCRDGGNLALLAYLTVGYPSSAATMEIAHALSEAGVDAVEFGIPFSDPLADGPTIQATSAAALRAGVTVEQCLSAAATFREADQQTALLFMGYYNPILQYGAERFAAAAQACGADGLIVPDLPLEEAEELDGPCRERGLGIVPLVAPNTSVDRISRLAARGATFLYVTTRLGVTGARSNLPPELPQLLSKVRRETALPLAVGFGISSPAQVASVRGLAEGAVVGSALLDRLAAARDPVPEVASFITPLVQAAHSGAIR